jgi:hypothetical protein
VDAAGIGAAVGQNAAHRFKCLAVYRAIIAVYDSTNTTHNLGAPSGDQFRKSISGYYQ